MPDLLEQFVDRAAGLLNDRNQAVVLAGATLMLRVGIGAARSDVAARLTWGRPEQAEGRGEKSCERQEETRGVDADQGRPARTCGLAVAW